MLQLGNCAACRYVVAAGAEKASRCAAPPRLLPSLACATEQVTTLPTTQEGTCSFSRQRLPASTSRGVRES